MFSSWRQHRIDQVSDQELLTAAQKGSSEAIAILYRRHSPLIYRYVLRLSRDAAIAEEVTQEVFLALLRHNNRYDANRGASLSTWLCGIARRQVWRHFERTLRFVPIDSPDEPFDPPSPDDDPAQLLTRAEAIAIVREGLEDLPLLLKEVIVLCELEELTYQQTSLILDIPIGTVRSASTAPAPGWPHSCVPLRRTTHHERPQPTRPRPRGPSQGTPLHRAAALSRSLHPAACGTLRATPHSPQLELCPCHGRRARHRDRYPLSARITPHLRNPQHEPARSPNGGSLLPEYRPHHHISCTTSTSAPQRETTPSRPSPHLPQTRPQLVCPAA